MKIIKMLPLLFVAILYGCGQPKSESVENTGKDSSLERAVSSPEPDTLVHSFPVKYIEQIKSLHDSTRFEISSYYDLLGLFDQHNYNYARWEAGISEVPRIFLTRIGSTWGSGTSHEITVQHKKEIFFLGLTPLVMRANELIMKDRHRLEQIRSEYRVSRIMHEADSTWIHWLSRLYKVEHPENLISHEVLDDLLHRVDIIPPSLALAQGAVESGWGTSRFAEQGNAIYGQWTWGSDAIVPEHQRTQLGHYGIASFGSLQESVCGYMLNLNTHHAYQELRNIRSRQRQSGENISGHALAAGLIHYSEMGEEYIESLRYMIDNNNLSYCDEATLSDLPNIYVIPQVLEWENE